MSDLPLPDLLRLNLGRCRDRFAELLKVGDFQSYRIQYFPDFLPPELGAPEEMVQRFEGRILSVGRSSFPRPAEGDSDENDENAEGRRRFRDSFVVVRTIYAAERVGMPAWREIQKTIHAVKTLLGWRMGRTGHAEDWLLFLHGLGWNAPVGLPYSADRFVGSAINVDAEAIDFGTREYFQPGGMNRSGLSAGAYTGLFIERQRDPTFFVSELSDTLFASIAGVETILTGSLSLVPIQSPWSNPSVGNKPEFVESRGYHVAEFEVIRAIIRTEIERGTAQEAPWDFGSAGPEPEEDEASLDVRITRKWLEYKETTKRATIENFVKTLSPSEWRELKGSGEAKDRVKKAIDRVRKQWKHAGVRSRAGK